MSAITLSRQTIIFGKLLSKRIMRKFTPKHASRGFELETYGSKSCTAYHYAIEGVNIGRECNSYNQYKSDFMIRKINLYFSTYSRTLNYFYGKCFRYLIVLITYLPHLSVITQHSTYFRHPHYSLTHSFANKKVCHYSKYFGYSNFCNTCLPAPEILQVPTLLN